MDKMTRYTVKQLADLARISVRTLHHYDDIGLLKPAYLGTNSYRYYEPPQLYRLQQILMYREFGLSLDEIANLVDAPDFDAASTLKAHRQRLTERLKQQEALLRVIDDTLARLGGDDTMQDNKLYAWQSPEKQAEYKQWLVERYGQQIDATIETSQKHYNAMSEAQRKALENQRLDIYRELIALFKDGVAAEDTTVDAILVRHREWLAIMWNRSVTPPAYAGLADAFLTYPEYHERLEVASPGFSAWLAAAMKHWADGAELPA